jgi:hypothetical protein
MSKDGNAACRRPNPLFTFLTNPLPSAPVPEYIVPNYHQPYPNNRYVEKLDPSHLIVPKANPDRPALFMNFAKATPQQPFKNLKHR